ncbi:MAG: 2,3-bisphosphoglycerate-independent phosphoglycerate mutase [Thermodesulfobacteriota bacterium]|nr:2,3-bisphosphoglycerate-independent phosphoglycerate mutase [Thermodesulfobacteriota bacterium]
MSKSKPLLLAILDGWGVGLPTETNAVFVADTPNMDQWAEKYPCTTLAAHNGAVGLPEGQMGNSEVGHLNIGAGRIVYQDFTRINRAVEIDELEENDVLVAAMEKLSAKKNSLHLLGLVSDGGVHSHLDHLLALVRVAVKNGLTKIFIHAFMDGRDTPPHSGVDYIRQLQEELAKIGFGRIASITGRYYAMDRDTRWERVEVAWQALVNGRGETAADPVQAVLDAYERGESDEFIKPIILLDDDADPVATIRDDDAILFFNFRADRARELTRAFTMEKFDGFDVSDRPLLTDFVMMTQYDKDFDLPILFPPLSLTHILGEEISSHGLRQLRIAETEKYAHVTFFFNGGREEPFPLEDRVLIPSPRDVATYDLEPGMSADKITDTLLAELDKDKYSLIILNFANGDMVGHTGKMKAAVAACETVDKCLGRLVKKIQEMDGTVLITADHGNADIMWNEETHEPFTAHTLNPVPFCLINDNYMGRDLQNGGALKDIAPTILTLLDLPIPAEMEGESLL